MPGRVTGRVTGRSTRRRWVLLLLALGLLLTCGGCSPVGGGDLRVTAMLDDSAGLFVGNDVGILGVPVGEVTAITPRGEVVEVELRIDASADVPASAGAVVVSRSVATDRYLELTPAFADGPRMEDGASIPIERTRTPVEFDEVLGSLQQFSDGLLGDQGDAAALKKLLRAGATALDGRGADLRRTLTDLSQAAGVLADNGDEISGTIGNLDELTQVLATNRVLVDRFIESIAGATDLFADERVAFGRSLTAMSRALESLAGFVKDNRVRLRQDLPRLTSAIEGVLRRSTELEESLEVLPLMMSNIGQAIGPDNRLDVKIPLTDLSPSEELIDAICPRLPEVCELLGTDPDLPGLPDLPGRVLWRGKW